MAEPHRRQAPTSLEHPREQPWCGADTGTSSCRGDGERPPDTWPVSQLGQPRPSQRQEELLP